MEAEHVKQIVFIINGEILVYLRAESLNSFMDLLQDQMNHVQNSTACVDWLSIYWLNLSPICFHKDVYLIRQIPT